MKNSLLKFALAASLILNLTVFATAGYHYYQQSRTWVSPFGKVMEKDRFLFEELSLRPEQLKIMKEGATKFRSVIDGKRNEITAHRKELITLLRQDDPDKKAIAAEVSRVSGIQEQMQAMIAMHLLDMKAELDEEQKKKFLDLIENGMTEGRQTGCPPGEHGSQS
jgi:Spy/CpxP family protein refolding chaperone